MTPQDIERIARDTGEIAFADGKYTLQKGDVIMSPDALAAYTARVLEEVAKAFDTQPHVEMFRPNVADEIRTIAASLGGKDGC
jgi:hypothetical protein